MSAKEEITILAPRHHRIAGEIVSAAGYAAIWLVAGSERMDTSNPTLRYKAFPVHCRVRYGKFSVKVFIGHFKVDEMTPSIEVAKNISNHLNTTVGYLLGETDKADLFKDPAMLKRFQDIAKLPEKEKECLLTTVDHFIKTSKLALI